MSCPSSRASRIYRQGKAVGPWIPPLPSVGWGQAARGCKADRYQGRAGPRAKQGSIMCMRTGGILDGWAGRRRQVGEGGWFGAGRWQASAPVPQLDHLRARIVERAAAEGSRRQSVGYAPLPAPLPRLIRHDHAHGLHRGLVPLTNEVARALDQEVVHEEPTVGRLLALLCVSWHVT